MTNKLLALSVAAALSIGLSAEAVSASGTISTASTAADPSTLNFSTASFSMADGSNTGNINTAASFEAVNFTSGAGGGIFSGFPVTNVGNVPLVVSNNTSFVVTNSVFGDFTSTHVTDDGGTAGHRDFTVLGDWTPGSFFSGMSAEPGIWHLSFNQTPVGNGNISMSGNFAPAPEPATLGLLALGLFGAGFAGRKRKT